MRVDIAITKYSEYRIGIGEKFRVNGYILRNFALHIGIETEIYNITEQQCKTFLYQKATKDGKITTYWNCIYVALNGFFLWGIAGNYIDIIPLPYDRPKQIQSFEPYIFTNIELKNIFETALNYRKRFNIVYPEVIQMMLKMTYMLGLRPSEAIRLNCSDIIMVEEDNYIVVRNTKFYKSRIVTFNKQVASLALAFLQWRRIKSMADSTDTGLFLDRKGNRMKLFGYQEAFRCICKKANIHRPDYATSRSDVRIQDLRHTFATNRIISWYEEGKNIQDLLPVLSTYLGHCNLDSTAVYISFTDMLLYQANNKFQSYINI